MQPFQFKTTLLSLSLISTVTAAGAAAGSVFSASEQSAEKAYEQHQYKKAETSLLKALDAAATEGTKDLDVARARVLLAKVYRESAKPQKASEQLVLALTLYKKLGFAEPVFADERNQLFKEYKQVDPGTLGQGYDALKNNSAVISIQKKDGGAHVEFTMPAPLEKSLNSPKVDGLQFEAVVSFDLATTGDGKVHASNIKGFKIHSVEKNTWANLLDLSVGGPANSEGTYDATIIAGKGGFTKTVAAKLPEKAYQPVKTIADQIEKFDGAPTLDIPIATAPAEVSPATAPVSTPTVTSTPVSTPTVTSTPVSTPTVTSTPASAPTVTSTPVSTPTVTSTPVSTPSVDETPISTPTVTETPVSTPTVTTNTDTTAPSWRETKAKTKKPLSSPAVERPVTTTTVESTSTPISTSTPEVFSPMTQTSTSTTSTTSTTTVTSPSSAISPKTTVEQIKVKSKHDDDDDDDDKEDAARKQRRREERRARRAAEDAKEAAEDAAEKLDDAKKREREREKDKDKDDDGDDKKDKDRKD